MLPLNLLNRSNRELKGKVDDLQGKVSTQKATLMLEKEVLAATETQVKEAKEKMQTVARLEEASRRQLTVANEGISQLKSEVSKTKQILTVLQDRLADKVNKLKELEGKVNASRSRYEMQQQQAKQNEAEAMQWFEENRLTQNATNAATSIFQDQSQEIAKKRREAERLVNIVNELQFQLSNEEQGFAAFSGDLQQCRENTNKLKDEVLKLQHDLADLHRRELDVGELENARKDRKKAMEEELGKRKAEIAALRAEMREEEDRANQASRQHSRAVEMMNRLTQRAVEAEASVEHELALLRGETSKVLNAKKDQAALRSEIATLKEKFDQTFQAYNKAQAQLEELTAKLDQAASTTPSLDNDDSLDAVRVALEGTLQDLLDLIDRGMTAIQAQITAQIKEAKATEDISREVVLLRAQTKKCDKNIVELKEKLSVQQQRSNELDDDIDILRQKVQDAEVGNERRSAQVRIKMEQEVQLLREELEEAEKLNRQLLRYTTALHSSALGNRREVEGSYAEIESLQQQMEELRTENKVLSNELELLFADRSRQSCELEALSAKASGLRVILQAKEGNLKANQATQEYLQRELLHLGKENEALDQLKGELKAEEHFRHTLHIKLNQHLAQRDLLKTKYDHLMDSLRLQVAADRVEGETVTKASSGNGSQATAAAAAGPKAENAIPLTELRQSLATPEEVEARLIVNRARVREELQKRGDFLDQSLVQAERDLQTLHEALAMVQSNPLEGEPFEEETMRFIEDIRDKFIANTSNIVADELKYWEVESTRLAEVLRNERSRQRQLDDRLAEVGSQLESERQHLRSLQRQFNETQRLTSSEQHHSSKVQNAVRIKQESVFNRPLAGSMLMQQQLQVTVDQVYHTLRERMLKLASTNREVYFAFRRAVDKYAPEGTFPLVPELGSSSQEVGQTLATSRIEFKGREASRALVDAIAQRPLTRERAVGAGAQLPKRTASAGLSRLQRSTVTTVSTTATTTVQQSGGEFGISLLNIQRLGHKSSMVPSVPSGTLDRFGGRPQVRTPSSATPSLRSASRLKQ
jgi:chromosome segregation ATPase